MTIQFEGYVEMDGDFYIPVNYNWNQMKVRKRNSLKIERIYYKEIEKAIIYTLKLHNSLPNKELIKVVSKHLGFKSVRNNIKDRFRQIMINMELNRDIVNKNDNIKLSENDNQ